MRVLQVSCSYLPDKVGGTEIYVHNLSKELIKLGFEISVNYVETIQGFAPPAIRIKEYNFEGIPVFIIEKQVTHYRTKDLYFSHDNHSVVYTAFKDYLKKFKPAIVHFHHFTSVDALEQMRAAKDMHIPIILTYHSPMMTCGHLDMLRFGELICDGRIDYKRCLGCAQTKYGIPKFIAFAWSNLPAGAAEYLGKSILRTNIKNRFATWSQLPWSTRKRIEGLSEGFKMVDHFVAVCKWVYELLINNNIPPWRISLCRQGVGYMPTVTRERNDAMLRLGYLGRIHPVKGVDILLNALCMIPSDYRTELHIYGSYQCSSDKIYYDRLFRKTRRDKRIKWHGVLTEDERFHALRNLDILIIPSRWLETGPLVLLESWAVGTPVIGVRLGGISELVVEGYGGLLFNIDDAGDLARVILRVYNEPNLLESLRSSIPKVRTMNEVADDMKILYSRSIP